MTHVLVISGTPCCVFVPIFEDVCIYLYVHHMIYTSLSTHGNFWKKKKNL